MYVYYYVHVVGLGKIFNCLFLTYSLELELLVVPEGVGSCHPLGVVLVPEIIGWEAKHLTLGIAIRLLLRRRQEETRDDLELGMGNGE